MMNRKSSFPAPNVAPASQFLITTFSSHRKIPKPEINKLTPPNNKRWNLYCWYLFVRWHGCRGILPRSQPIAGSIRTRDIMHPRRKGVPPKIPRYHHTCAFHCQSAKPPVRYHCQTSRTGTQHKSGRGPASLRQRRLGLSPSIRQTLSCAADARAPINQN